MIHPLWFASLLACLPVFGAGILRHAGICDGSAAVGLPDERMLVACDEDNILRVYSVAEDGPAQSEFDLNEFLNAGSDRTEADLEGAARIANRAFWIGSHSASEKGKPRPERRRFFATDVLSKNGDTMVIPAGKPCATLVEDFSSHPNLAAFKLNEASQRAPEEERGLSIEGLAEGPDDTLLVALRSPLVEEKALIIPLENPAAVVTGEKAIPGQPILLDLGGLGIRDIHRVNATRGYLIVAGPSAKKGPFQLYRWSGDAARAPERLPQTVDDLRPESITTLPGREKGFLLISDDSGLKLGGMDCQNQSPSQRAFRSQWLAW